MNDKAIKTGTLSVLTGIIITCTVTLLVLSVSTVMADSRMAARYGESVAALYAQELLAQEWLAELDADIAGNKYPQNVVVEKIIGDEKQKHLSIVVEVNASTKTYLVKEWKVAQPVIEQGVLDNLWNGKG